jgi:hypothetical protein
MQRSIRLIRLIRASAEGDSTDFSADLSALLIIGTPRLPEHVHPQIPHGKQLALQ